MPARRRTTIMGPVVTEMTPIQVLYIEDDMRQRQALAKALRRRGFKVATARSGKHGLGLAARNRYHVILTDLAVPGLKGLEVLDQIRKCRPTVPVIILTAHGGIETAAEAIRRGAYHFVLKPFEIEDIELTILQAVENGRLQQRLHEYSATLELKVAERTERLQFAYRQMAALTEVSNRFTRLLDEETLWLESCRVLTETLDFDRAGIMLIIDGKLQIECSAFAQDDPELVQDFLQAVAEERWKFPPAFYECLNQNQTVFIADLNSDPRWIHDPERPTRTKALILAPLREAGRPIGVLLGSMQHHERSMDEQDIARFEIFANIVSLTIDHIRAFQSLGRQVQERTASLEEKTRELERVNAELQAAKSDLELKNVQTQRMLDELSRSRNELQAVFDSSLSLLIFVDINNRIAACNPRVTDYFGLDPNKVVGQGIEDFIEIISNNCIDAERVRRILGELITQPRVVEEIRADIHRLNAFVLEVLRPSVRTLAPWAVPVVGRQGEHLGVFFGFSDITQLKRADEQVHAIINAAPIPLIISSYPDGEILYANEHLSALVNLTPEEMVGRPAPEFYHDPRDRIELIKMLAERGRAHREVRIKTPTGDSKWMIFTLNLTTMGDRKVIIGGLYDISQRKAMEEEVRRERNFITAVLNTAGALVIVLDADGRIVQFNRACEQISGYHASETVGRHVWDFLLLPEDVDRIKQTFADIKAERLIGRVENYWISRSGDKRLIAWNNTELLTEDGRVEFVIGTGIDITEQRAAEESLRFSEERFRGIVENANDLIYLLDQSGRFTCISPNWTNQLGHQPGELLGHPFMEMIHPDDRPRCEDCFTEMMQSLQRMSGIEYRVFHRDGSIRWQNSSISALKSETGDVRYYIGIGHDVTERKLTLDELAQAYRNLRLTQGQLVQSEKMASLGMLVAGIAHEINTPIGAVASMHNTLVRAIEKLTAFINQFSAHDPDELAKINETLRLIQDANRVIVSGTDRVVNIVRRLRSFARLDEAELKKVNIHEGLEDTLTLIHHEIKHNITLTRRFGDIPEISCFPGRLNQVFLNILINAKQAIKDKGEITISTFVRDGKVCVEIADTGVGIPEENLARIFDPGFTTKGVGVGTGLGLSICYQIIQDHRGDIQVASQVGKGTRFTIILPMNLDEILEGAPS